MAHKMFLVYDYQEVYQEKPQQDRSFCGLHTTDLRESTRKVVGKLFF